MGFIARRNYRAAARESTSAPEGNPAPIQDQRAIQDHSSRALQGGLLGQYGTCGGIANCEAFVGGGGVVKDYTVLGDTVNVAARLQGAAAPGEILITEESYAFIESQFPDAPQRELELKGKSGMVTARVIMVS
jgi:class 3 adenylate cyclase